MNEFLWYSIRAAGITSYLLLFGSVAFGLELSRRRRGWWRGATGLLIHTTMTWLSLAFLGLHMGALLVDQFVHFSLFDILIPFHAAYEPVWTGIGVIAFYAALLVAVSTAWRRRHYRLWRSLHSLSFVAFAGATLHGIMSGSDTRAPWMLAIYLVSGLTVAVLTVLRVGERLPVRDADRRWATGAAAGLAMVGLVVMSLSGRLFRSDSGTENPQARALPATASGAITTRAGSTAAPATRNLSAVALHWEGRAITTGGGWAIQGTMAGDLNGTFTLNLTAGGRGQGERSRREPTRTTTTADEMSGNIRIFTTNGDPAFTGSARLDDGRLQIIAGGTGAYTGQALQLTSTRSQVTDGTLVADMTGQIQPQPATVTGSTAPRVQRTESSREGDDEQ